VAEIALCVVSINYLCNFVVIDAGVTMFQFAVHIFNLKYNDIYIDERCCDRQIAQGGNRKFYIFLLFAHVTSIAPH
jgi:hypothetical protein